MITPRLALGAALGCAGLLVAAPAAAQTFAPLELDAPHEEYHSPQHFAVEFKFGLYSPNIDATAGLTGRPFAELFNNQYTTEPGQRPSGKSLITLELDWQFWHPFGSIGLAGSIGYSGRKSHSFEYILQNNDSSNPISCTPGVDCVRSADTTSLHMLPLTLELVYRFDVLAERWHIPLVPYVKAGIAYYIWFMTKGDGNLARGLSSSDPAKDMSAWQAYGGTAGFVVHPGIALQLDAFDRGAAQTLDSELGINHSYIFAELNYASITGLGFQDKINLSDTTWNAGIAFEF